MNKTHFIKTGNLFEFAENRLIEKLKRGDIYAYSLTDIINLAIKVRKYMDKNPQGLKIPTMTRDEKNARNRISRKQNYISK